MQLHMLIHKEDIANVLAKRAEKWVQLVSQNTHHPVYCRFLKLLLGGIRAASIQAHTSFLFPLQDHHQNMDHSCLLGP